MISINKSLNMRTSIAPIAAIYAKFAIVLPFFA